MKSLEQKRRELGQIVPPQAEDTVNNFIDSAHQSAQQYNPAEPRNMIADYMETPSLGITKQGREDFMNNLPEMVTSGMLGSVGTMENAGGKVIQMFKNPPREPPNIPSESSLRDRFLARFGSDKTDPIAWKTKASMDMANKSNQPYSKALSGPMQTVPNDKFSITQTGQEIGHPGISEPFNTNNPDPLLWMEDKYNVLKNELQKSNMPVKINTSSDLIGKSDYINSLHRDSEVNMYMLTKDEGLNRQLFPGNASRLRQEKAVQNLKDAGINVNQIEPTEESIRQAIASKTPRQGLKFGEDIDLDSYLKRPGVFPLRMIKGDL